MKVIAVIPIRAGSKGLKNKNILSFCGSPLYLHAVEQGLRTADEVIISTDIQSVIDGVHPAGCSVHRRPENLCGDSTTMDEVLIDLCQNIGSLDTNILLLQATSPLRSDLDVKRALACYRESNFNLVMSVTPADNGVLKYGTVSNNRYSPLRSASHCFSNRQMLPEVFRPNGAVYVFNSKWILDNKGLADENIGSILMPGDRSADIDTKDDFLRAEKLFGKN